MTWEVLPCDMSEKNISLYYLNYQQSFEQKEVLFLEEVLEGHATIRFYTLIYFYLLLNGLNYFSPVRQTDKAQNFRR